MKTNNKVKFEEYEDENLIDFRYMGFSQDSEDYLIDIKYVTEIIGIQNITPLPNSKSFLKGIINLRGIIIPIISTRLRFGKEEIDFNARTCIIVLNFEDNNIGLIVDNVTEVYHLLPENISLPPDTNKGTNSNFIKGIGQIENKVCMILDIEKLLIDKENMSLN
jgi:purine-binding chemotaxis protein CheW